MPAPRSKLCLVSSGGGHLAELRALRPVFAQYEHFVVLNNTRLVPPEFGSAVHFIAHAERDWRVLLNLWEAWRILDLERPDVILTTGAGPAVPFAIVGKLMGIPTVFVEISAQVRSPSLTGRILHALGAQVFYQWESLRPHYPRGVFGGLLWF